LPSSAPVTATIHLSNCCALRAPTRCPTDSWTQRAWSRAIVDGAGGEETALDPAAADRLLARTKQNAALESGAPPRSARWAPAFALAAAAAVVLAFIVWRIAGPPAPPVTVAERNVPPPVTAAPAPTPPARGFRLELTKPPVKLTAAALLLRGDATSGRFVDDIANALNAYRAGRYEEATRELAALQPRYPRSVEIPFYAGVSRLMLADAPAAVRALESARALNDDTVADEAAWYLAVAYERSGNADRARPLLGALCRGSSAYVARACAAAETLR
jgi:TolA-binding protein